MQHDEPHATMIGIHASTAHAGTPVARTVAGNALITCEPIVPASLLCLRELLQTVNPHACAPTHNQLSQHINNSIQPTAALQYGFTKTLYDSTTYNTSPRARADALYDYNFDSTLGYPGGGSADGGSRMELRRGAG